MAALGSPASRGMTYELGGPTIYTFRELMELLLKQIERADDDGAIRQHALLPIPFWLAEIKGAVLQMLPNAPLTLDQVKLLKHDSIVGAGVGTIADLGIQPTAPELILPSYLDRYRRGGWYSVRKMA